MIHFIYFILTFAMVFSENDNVPGKKQVKPILLKGGTVHIGNGTVIENADVLFDKGRIVQVGKNLQLSADTEVIDVNGKHVYPGLISALTNLGIVEISSVRATRDYSEIGQFTPEVLAGVAYNPDSELIPVVRAHGITTVMTQPSGGLVSGRSTIINLDSWTVEDGAELREAGLMVRWPNMRVNPNWSRPVKDQQEAIENNLKQLYDFFTEAKKYHYSAASERLNKTDQRFHLMLPVFDKKMTVYISADRYKEIVAALQFIRYFDIKAVLTGVNEAYKAIDLIKESNVPLVLTSPFSTPYYEDDDYDVMFRLPKTLKDAGIQFCLSLEGSWKTVNLPFSSGQAVAYGLSKEEALSTITLDAAKVLGIDNVLGSLESGKKATIVVSEGDILDPITHKVIYEFVEGRKVDLNNKHKELYKKYQQKN